MSKPSLRVDDKRFGNNLFLRIEKHYFASPTCHKNHAQVSNALHALAVLRCTHASYRITAETVSQHAFSCNLASLFSFSVIIWWISIQILKNRGHLKLPGCVLNASNTDLQKLRVNSVMVVWQDRSPRESKTVLWFLRMKKLPYSPLITYC